jgi:hypothetical protein
MSKYSPPKPNFFIVGAAKSGTTSLWMYLKQHPNIFMPETINLKEPSYFCNLYGIKDYSKYLSIFEKAKGVKAIGEASTPYLSSPESANWIKQEYPLSKIIIILRNPVKRAYSLYNWMISEGYEWIFPFEKALEIEENRLKDTTFKYNNPQYFYNYLYFQSGLYSEQLKRYLDLFPKEQIRIYLFEDLKRDSLGLMREIYDFLGVDSSFTPNNNAIFNAGKVPRSVKLQFFIKQKLPKYLCKIHFPKYKKIQEIILDANCIQNQNQSGNLRAETKKDLQQCYKEDIEKTEKLINRNLEKWYGK